MGKDTVKVEYVLTRAEYAEIDRFCGGTCSASKLVDLRDFLKNRFALEITIDLDVVSGFITDSSNLSGSASGLCRPSTEREVAVIFRACFVAGIPYTISAGKSNLTGSATPSEGIVISTVNMREPAASVDMASMTASAPVGAILEDFRNEVLALSDNRLMYPVNPTSRADAAVGGTIACNASGFTPGEQGSTRPWVDTVDFMLPNGLKLLAKRGQYVSVNGAFMLSSPDGVVSLPVPAYHRPRIKNAGGPWSSDSGEMDFVDFVVGSEGIFGMVTACRLKLTKRPPDYLDIFFSLSEEREALAFFRHLHARMKGNFDGLTALEYFGVNCRSYMDHETALFQGGNQVGINIQAPVFKGTVEDAAEEWLGFLIEADCGIDEDAVLVLDDERVRKIFFEARHSLPANALETVQKRGGFTIMTDTVVPPEHFEEFLQFAHDLLASERIEYLTFGHLGDCHLHFMLLPEKNLGERAREIYDMLVAKSAELGGVYSGEHGTGKRKRQDFVRCYGTSAADEVRRCKAALDPKFLLNRGNVVEKN